MKYEFTLSGTIVEMSNKICTISAINLGIELTTKNLETKQTVMHLNGFGNLCRSNADSNGDKCNAITKYLNKETIFKVWANLLFRWFQ